MIHKINHANIKEWAKNYDGPQFDGILCDPPYELGFMGKSWDSSGIAFDVEMWADLFRHIKPGGHLLAFSGSRTYHRMAVAIEDAGFEIRDMIEWVYGSGFPKSLNIGKAVDKIQGNEREAKPYEYPDGKERTKFGVGFHGGVGEYSQTERPQNMTTKGTSEWEGYGTALKPAHEPCVLARKPLDKGMTVAGNVLKHGTGGLAIDNTRVKANNDLQRSVLFEIIGVCQLDHLLLPANSVELKRFQDDTTNAIKKLCSVLESADTPTSEKTLGTQQEDIIKKVTSCLEETLTENTKLSLNTSGYGKKPTDEISQQDMKSTILTVSKMITDWKISSSSVSQLIEVLLTQAKTLKTTNDVQGRFPSNLIHDGSDEVEAVFPQSKGMATQNSGKNIKVYTGNSLLHSKTEFPDVRIGFNDNGSASRFFYCAKASKSERNAGLEGFEPQFAPKGNNEGRDMSNPKNHMGGMQGSKMSNFHPTVKPLSLTKYLATLIKPPTGGRLLVPFSGSGSEMIGALQAGWEYVEGVELTEEYIPISEARIKYWTNIKEEKSNQMELI